MDKSYEKKYHKLEEKNWWFISRRNFISQLMKKIGIDQNAKVLEIGCSGGPLIEFLGNTGYSDITGIDLSKDAIDLCKKRGIKKVRVMDGAKTLFRENEFDLIIASDILEHIKDDDSALCEWYRLLKPKGELIVFVPAFNFLWSGHDEVNKHFRRYNKPSLISKMKKAQFKLQKVSYWNFFLFFPTYLLRTFQHSLLKKKSESKDQLFELNPLINRILITLLKFENFLLKYFNFPIGVSIFVVGRK